MSSEIAMDKELQRFNITDAAIVEIENRYMPLVISGIDDTEGYKRVHAARMVVKNYRCQVEKVRKELKADALEYGRRVDAEARRITQHLEPIENHLLSEEKRVDDENERIKNAARLEADAKAKAIADAEAARIKAAEDAERARIKAEQDAENERLRIEREKIATEQAKLAEERRAIEAEQKRLADIEAARLCEIENERIRKEAAERSRIETEQRIAREAAAEKARIEAEESTRLRAEALRPDREKLLSVATAINAIDIPEVSDEMQDARERVMNIVSDAADAITRLVNRW
jgi:hypothetical protein